MNSNYLTDLFREPHKELRKEIYQCQNEIDATQSIIDRGGIFEPMADELNVHQRRRHAELVAKLKELDPTTAI